jgi:hypothetical protein
MPVPVYGNGRARAERPRARRSLVEGGADPQRGRARSGYAHSLERGGAHPREVCALERGGARLRGSLSGPSWWAVRATVAWAIPRVFKRDVFGLGFLQILSGVSPVV